MSYVNRPLNRQDYKTLTLAAWAARWKFYDFIIFVFFAAVVGELFFPADIPEWLRQVQTLAFSPPVTWRVRWGHHHGPLWRSGGAQENVHPQHPADGATNHGDRSATDL